MFLFLCDDVGINEHHLKLMHIELNSIDQIEWKAKLSLTSDEQQDMVMADPEQKSGSIICPKGARECLIDISIRKDDVSNYIQRLHEICFFF